MRNYHIFFLSLRAQYTLINCKVTKYFRRKNEDFDTFNSGVNKSSIVGRFDSTTQQFFTFNIAVFTLF